MASLLFTDLSEEIGAEADDPDKFFMVSGVSWAQYEALLEQHGDSPWYRVTYLEGVLEIKAPSCKHDRNKTNIGMLLEAYFQEARIRFYGLGSTTFRDEKKEIGTEPDECYCIGSEKEFPDLAVEVVETSGSINKLAVYRGLGVPEVWFWKKGQLEVYSLRGQEYEKVSASELLPNLDLALLATYVQNPEPLDAVIEFREKVREQMQKGNE